MFTERNAMTAKGVFRDVGGSYKRVSDYLIELKSEHIIAIRFHIDSTIFCTIYEFFFFYQAYARLMLSAGKKPSVKGLWKKTKYHAYPMIFNHMAKYVMTNEPIIKSKEAKRLCSVVSTYLCDICTRQMIRDCKLGMSEEDMSSLITTLLLFMEKKMGRSLHPNEYQSFMDLLFLEKKKMPLPNNLKEFLSLLTVKFNKQLNRPEDHLYHLFLIMNSLELPLPDTSNIGKLFNKSLNT
jgi:hypothetical protein